MSAPCPIARDNRFHYMASRQEVSFYAAYPRGNFPPVGRCVSGADRSSRHHYPPLPRATPHPAAFRRQYTRDRMVCPRTPRTRGTSGWKEKRGEVRSPVVFLRTVSPRERVGGEVVEKGGDRPGSFLGSKPLWEAGTGKGGCRAQEKSCILYANVRGPGGAGSFRCPLPCRPTRPGHAFRTVSERSGSPRPRKPGRRAARSPSNRRKTP